MGDLLQRYGHEAVDVRDIGLRGVKDSQIASYAQSRKMCIVTGDFDFSNIRNYRIKGFRMKDFQRLPTVAGTSDAAAFPFQNRCNGFTNFRIPINHQN